MTAGDAESVEALSPLPCLSRAPGADQTPNLSATTTLDNHVIVPDSSSLNTLSGPELSESSFYTYSENSHTSGHKRKRESGSFLSEDQRKRRQPATGSQEDYICEECHKIDFQKFLELDAATLASATSGVLIANLGTRLSQPSEESCTLCRLLATAAAQFNNGEESLELRAYSILEFSWRIRSYFCPKYLISQDQPFLAVTPLRSNAELVKNHADAVGYIFCDTQGGQKTSLFSPQIIPQSMDLSLVARWLDYCKVRHNKLCGGRIAQLSSLNVIDCDSISVVLAPPSCSYAALSYVWSRASRVVQETELHSCNTTKNQLQYASKTIMDAITVTKELGLQYLWVDKFCIDQGNPNEKHDQIQNMSNIYRGAEITIIAAAGPDEDYGLPGIGTTPRVPQLIARVEKAQIICTMIHPHREIESSTWSTRGWTYQEAVLSRRRIVFTDHQVYYECNAMNCYESLKGNLDILHTKNKSTSLQMLHSGILSGREEVPFASIDVENYSLRESFKRYIKLIINYSSRNLTFEEDSLNAFTGIAKHLANSKLPIFHVWGLPFPSPSHLAESSEDKTFFSYSLLWRHDSDKVLKSKVPTRRYAFPSWTWAGWEGQVRFPQEYSEFFDSEVQNIFFEFGPETMVEYSSFLRSSSLDDIQHCSPQALHLDVMIASPETLSFSDSVSTHCWEIGGREATFYLSDHQADISERPMTIVNNFKERIWLLILIGSRRSNVSCQLYFMIVSRGISFASRVGVVIVRMHSGEENIPGMYLSPGRIRLL